MALLFVGVAVTSAALAEGQFALAALFVVAVATPIAYYKPIVLLAVPLLLGPLLGRTGESTIGPFNALSIVALWFLGISSILVLSKLKLVMRERLCAVWAALIVVTALSILTSSMKTTSLEETVRLASAILMLPTAYLIAQDPRTRRTIVLVLFIAALFPIFFGFYQVLTGDYDFGRKQTLFELRSGIERISSTFFDSHPYAKFLMALLPPAAVMLLWPGDSTRAKFAWLGVFALLFSSLVLTYARSQLIGFFIAGLIILYQLKKINVRMLLFGIPLLLMLLFGGGIVDRFADLAQPIDFESGVRENSLESRFLIWAEGFPRALTRPLLGHGAATFQHDIGIVSHNAYLGLFYEIGFLGPILYLAALIMAAKTAHSCFLNQALSPFDRKLALAMLALSVATMVVSGAENYTQATITWWIYFALLGCLLAGRRQQQEPQA